jgi:hypothetical protein
VFEHFSLLDVFGILSLAILTVIQARVRSKRRRTKEFKCSHVEDIPSSEEHFKP